MGWRERDPNKQPKYWRKTEGTNLGKWFSPSAQHSFFISKRKTYLLTLLHSLPFNSFFLVILTLTPCPPPPLREQNRDSTGLPSRFVFKMLLLFSLRKMEAGQGLFVIHYIRRVVKCFQNGHTGLLPGKWGRAWWVWIFQEWSQAMNCFSGTWNCSC